MDKENLEISVIICAYTMERPTDIHEAVNSVLNQTVKPREVILPIDNNEELFESLQSLVHTSKSRARTQNSELKVVLNTGTRCPN